MIDPKLSRKLDRVARRIRSQRMWTALAICWICCAAAGGAALWAHWQAGWSWQWTAPALGIAAAAAAIASGLYAVFSARDYRWVARVIETRYPQLDSRLLTAVEQRAEGGPQPFGYLQQSLINEALLLDHRHPWTSVAPSPRIAAFQITSLAALVLLAGFSAVLVAFPPGGELPSMPSAPLPGMTYFDGSYEYEINPGDAEVERGASLLVLARFTGGRTPPEATLSYVDASGESASLAMSLSLDDPVFAGRIPEVKSHLIYHVEFEGITSDDYRITVFEYPRLVRADARLVFPEYTKMESTLVQDTRSLTAVEGTEVTILCALNKPVADAALADEDGNRLPLELAEGEEPNVYATTITLSKSQRYKLLLLDDADRPNQNPAEIVLNVIPNKTPQLKLLWPSRDVQVSPLEEIALRAELFDDFGLIKYGLSYSIGGGEAVEVELGENGGGKQEHEAAHLLQLEALNAEPDQLVSYHFWAEDHGPGGEPRRTFSDMFFAEVRPFEEIFRQGEQPPGGQNQQQQQQQGGQNAQQAQQLAELQKQIISGAWNVVRREVPGKPGPKFVGDSRLLLESQQQALEMTEQLVEQVEDEQSLAHVDEVKQHMTTAIEHLQRAVDEPSVEAHHPGLAAEQAAYQAILKLRAREHSVFRANQQQSQSSSSSSSSGNRSQQQLQQLQLDENENRYETQNTASPQEDQQQRETRQVLNRLRELARRQGDLNEQLKQLQSALEEAETEEERDQLLRELKRLREQQQEILRDADDVRNRMDRPTNQQQMSESSQQLREARENVRQASEALEEGRLSQAVSSGTRAQRQLAELRDEFRRQASGRFAEEMREMRQDAQQLDENQDQLSEQLAELDNASRKSLRDSGERQQIVDALGEQRGELDDLLQRMQETTQEAEQAEPLLSSQLYDTLRDAKQNRVEDALDAANQLLERGFLDEARQAERPAGEGIRNLREGVEKAAESVLGDEVEALRRARDVLNQIADAVNQEIARNSPGDQAQDQQSPNGDPRQSRGGQPGQGDPSERQQNDEANQQSGGNRQPGQQDEQQNQNAEQSEGQRRGDENSPENQNRRGQGGNQPGQPREGQQDQENQDQENQDGQRNQEGQPGQQEGRSQRGQSQEGQGRQQQPGDQQPQDAQQNQQQGNRGQGGQGGNRSQDPQNNDPNQQQQQNQDGQQQQSQANQPGQNGQGQNRQGQNRRNQGGRQNGNPNGLGGFGPWLAGADDSPDPLTGDDYQDFVDNLRDVEEMIDDPELRAEAARIRDRAREFRLELKRHSRQPQWSLVREFVGQPLYELRDRVAEEVLRRASPETLIPIDRDPVPDKYSRQVSEYYEQLGKGD